MSGGPTPSSNRPGGSLSAWLLRITCPTVFFLYLAWQAVASANWKFALCLLALVATLVGGAFAIGRLSAHCRAAATEAERQRRLAAALQLTRRLGGVFCGMALGVGLCYTFETGRFFSIALPLLLSGWGAMFWLFRRAFR